jgi:ribosomal protein L1
MKTIDAAVQLGVDAKKSGPRCHGAVTVANALVRPSVLPFFAQAAKADEAKVSHADII